jgi:hypothetical protein
LLVCQLSARNIRRFQAETAPLCGEPRTVLRSASTYLLIVMALLWYISDRAKLHFGREAQMSGEFTVLYDRSRPSEPSREDIRLTPSDACRLIAICIDLIDLCAKVTGKIDPALASIVAYARDEALSAALKN